MAPAQTLETTRTDALNTNGNGTLKGLSTTEFDVLENYEGQYRFAPIEEAQVSRAMIKRCVYANCSARVD